MPFHHRVGCGCPSITGRGVDALPSPGGMWMPFHHRVGCGCPSITGWDVDALPSPGGMWMPFHHRVGCGCPSITGWGVDALPSPGGVWMPFHHRVGCGCHGAFACAPPSAFGFTCRAFSRRYAPRSDRRGSAVVAGVIVRVFSVLQAGA